MAPPALKANQDALCSLAGTVTDSMGAVVSHAKITITNLDTGVARTLATNEAGQYVANDLRSGRYSVMAAAPSFKTTLIAEVELKPGHQQSGLKSACSSAGDAANMLPLLSRCNPKTCP